MEQAKKHLKVSSFVVLLFAVLTLVEIVAELLYGEINSAPIPEGAPENILMITKGVVLGISLLLLLPKIYVGIKGLWVAKKPSAAKGHIIWAVIIFVFSVLDLIDPAVAILKQESVGENVSRVFAVLLEVLIYYDFIKYAGQVKKLATAQEQQV